MLWLRPRPCSAPSPRDANPHDTYSDGCRIEGDNGTASSSARRTSTTSLCTAMDGAAVRAYDEAQDAYAAALKNLLGCGALDIAAHRAALRTSLTVKGSVIAGFRA